MEHGDATKKNTVKEKTKKVPYLPPCRVCDSVASGFHYGVNTCEACKGFYRRSVARETDYPACTSGSECIIHQGNRTMCSACRFNKCVDVGMSKNAIKTGRYTHKKRTSDTLEIKQSSSAGDLASPTGASNASSDLESSSSCHQFAGNSPLSNPMQSEDESQEIISLSDIVSNAFRKCFPDTVYLYERSDDINHKVVLLLKEQNLSEISRVLYSPGTASSNDEDQKQLSNFVIQAERIRSFNALNKHLSADALQKLPEYKLLARLLFEAWSSKMERLLGLFIQFAKRLPLFESLPINDQIILIKAARSEVATLVMSKHFMPRWSALVDHRVESGTITLVPRDILSTLYMANEDFPEESDHYRLFGRCLRQMLALEMTIENVAAICAISVFSSDREGLSNESLLQVAKIQEQFSQVLAYTLKKSHPSDKSAFSKVLMLLPSLRVVNEYNTQSIAFTRENLNPTLPPLLNELLSVSTENSDSNSKIGQLHEEKHSDSLKPD